MSERVYTLIMRTDAQPRSDDRTMAKFDCL